MCGKTRSKCTEMENLKFIFHSRWKCSDYWCITEKISFWFSDNIRMFQSDSIFGNLQQTISRTQLSISIYIWNAENFIEFWEWNWWKIKWFCSFRFWLLFLNHLNHVLRKIDWFCNCLNRKVENIKKSHEIHAKKISWKPSITASFNDNFNDKW